MIRLGMATNALLSQHRLTVEGMKTPGAAGARDQVCALVTASALTHEAIQVISGDYRLFRELAQEAGATPELWTVLGQLQSGRHELSPLLVRVRNQLGFHWDAGPVEASLNDFTDYAKLVWHEGRDYTLGETIFRLALDVLVNSLWPEEAIDVAVSPDERRTRLEARVGASLIALNEVMDQVAGLITFAQAGFLMRIEATPQSRPPRPGVGGGGA